MANRFQTLFRFLILGIFFLCVYILSIFSPHIKSSVTQAVNTSTGMILGVKTVQYDPSKEQTKSVADKVATDLQVTAEAAKETGMNLRVGDIVGSVGRLTKVIEDARSLMQSAKGTLEDFAKQQ